MGLIVMTGATTGLGRVAAQRLLARPGSRLVTGVRRPGSAPAGAEERPLDLASLASVRAFADSLAGERIDALVLNAGGQRIDVSARTTDGYETTFATNHLAHYLLLRRLLPQLADDARIVITSSGTHDPAEKTGVPPPHHADAARLADPASDPQRDSSAIAAGMRAYSASKLCNLLTVRSVADSAEAAARGWTVAAYDPGLTPGTGLVRNAPWVVRTLVWPLLLLLVPFAKGMNTLADAGGGLAQLATDATPPAGRVYAALRKGRLTWPDPSELARNDTVRDRLWADSERLVAGYLEATPIP